MNVILFIRICCIKGEIDRITNSTEYNGLIYLLVNTSVKIPDPNMLNRANTPPFEVQVGKNWYEGVDAIGIDNPFGETINVIRIKFDQIDTSTVGFKFR